MEGVIWLIKQTCLEVIFINGDGGFSAAQYALIGDESYDLKNNGETMVQTTYLKLPDNLRFTVKTVNWLFKSQLDLKLK